MEVFMYVAYLDQSNAVFLYFVVHIRRRRKKFTFAISSADEFLVIPGHSVVLGNYTIIYFATMMAGYSMLGFYSVEVMHSFKFIKT